MDFQINLVSFTMLVIVESISYLLFVDFSYSICFSVYFYSFFLLGYIQTIAMIMDSTLAIAFSFRVIIVGKDFAY
jgi:hypothetical protein